MFEKIRKMKNKKGFTLVELIVVLVILAILAALLIPALTGYIDKANQEKIIAECRSVAMAAQTTASEYYGLNKTLKPDAEGYEGATTASALEQIKTLSEAGSKWEYQITTDEKGNVTEVVFNDGNAGITYTKNVTTGETTFSTVTAGKTGASNDNSTINGANGTT